MTFQNQENAIYGYPYKENLRGDCKMGTFLGMMATFATAQTVMPPPATISGCSCSNLCPYPADGWCDDGGPGAEYNCVHLPHTSIAPLPHRQPSHCVSHLRPYSLLPRH